jgi:hypothetical protein
MLASGLRQPFSFLPPPLRGPLAYLPLCKQSLLSQDEPANLQRARPPPYPEEYGYPLSEVLRLGNNIDCPLCPSSMEYLRE